MKKTVRLLLTFFIAAFLPPTAVLAEPALSFTKLWTYDHSARPNFLAEIPAFDPRTNTLWVSGVVGVEVLDAATGVLVDHIDITRYGSINSVAIHNGLAAFAIEAAAPFRSSPGVVVFYDTKTRSLADGENVIPVGALPDMLIFTPNGRKLLVANEATPSSGEYGPRLDPGTPAPFVSPPGRATLRETSPSSTCTPAR